MVCAVFLFDLPPDNAYKDDLGAFLTSAFITEYWEQIVYGAISSYGNEFISVEEAASWIRDCVEMEHVLERGLLALRSHFSDGGFVPKASNQSTTATPDPKNSSPKIESRLDDLRRDLDVIIKNMALQKDVTRVLSIIEEKQKAKPPIFSSANNHYLEWEGLAFRHSTEVELAKELDCRGITFFPSAGVRITNQLTEERKTLEPDFLVCNDGKWGIIELDGDSHKEKHYSDAQRARIFKKQGISIVESYPSTMPPEKIVDDFLEILRMS